jgi:hypothetical protein
MPFKVATTFGSHEWKEEGDGHQRRHNTSEAVGKLGKEFTAVAALIQAEQ